MARPLPSDGAPLLYVPTHLAQTLAADLMRAGIPKNTVEGKLDFHAIRLAYINLVIEAGATVKEAQTLARHAKPQMTLGVYGRTREERLHQVVEQIAMVLHGETQRVGSVHRVETTENGRTVTTSGSGTYGAAQPVEAAGELPDVDIARHQYTQGAGFLHDTVTQGGLWGARR